MNTKRRIFLKGTLAGSAVAVAVGAGLLNPRQVLAAWPKAAFEAKDIASSLKGVYDADMTTPSNDIEIKAPDIAENGAVVPVTVNANIKGIESISLFVEQNATPLTAVFNLAPNAVGTVSTRVKMGKTSNVVAVVKAGGGMFAGRKEVKVTIGGCGG
ncbi:MAG: thiosulfate oxidation carrier protein SoxY [Pseudomonadota bacterium]